MSLVAPFAGAWIEIEYIQKRMEELQESLPSQGRGLKYSNRFTE